MNNDLFIVSVLKVEIKAIHMLNRCSAAELHSSPGTSEIKPCCEAQNGWPRNLLSSLHWLQIYSLLSHPLECQDCWHATT